jgi:hypothetical protein
MISAAFPYQKQRRRVCLCANLITREGDVVLFEHVRALGPKFQTAN